MLLDFTLHSGLEVTGPGRTGEIDSLEGLVVVEGSGIHEDDRGLGGTSSTDE
jgi:hypothetical protein